MATYYNEIDLFAAQWLRNLMAAGLIPDGDVDTRSIVDVRPADLTGFDACHFFAGIGGWALALRFAGWPDDQEVWTGSCPCQPWSIAGAQAGTSDQRDLWPAWLHLIRKRLPHRIFGEQVESPLARTWLDRVFDDLEHLEYAVGAINLPAACVGAPHKRQRAWFVADAAGAHGWGRPTLAHGDAEKPGRSSALSNDADWPDRRGRGSVLTVADLVSPSYGFPGRVGRLRAYGNAIVPQVAAEVIGAYMDLRLAETEKG